MDQKHIKRLLFFSEVVRSGSFAGAARQLSLPRSSVSEHVKQLEIALGVQLLQRTTRRLSLTPEGEAVLENALEIEKAIAAIESAVDKGSPSGVVTISLTQDVAKTWLLPKLKEFYTAYPDISINVIADDQITDLVQDRIDLALRVTLKGKNSNLIGRILGEEALCLHASPEYLHECGCPTSIEALNQHRWILLSQLNQTRSLTLQDKRKTVNVTPMRFYETNAPEIQRQMIEMGLGIGLHLPTLAQPAINRRTVQPILEAFSSSVYEIMLVYPSRRLPLRTRVFVDFLMDKGWP